MSEAENKPSIRIHLDQQVTIEAVQGQEEVEDALVATEITGFDVEDDLYVLRGALSFSGFLRQEDLQARGNQLPDALDDGDIFATDDAVAEAPVLPFHHRLPFLLQVPVAAQVQHQRENGILNVNPKIGQWNVHVLGEGTVHLRAELIIQGLSGQEGYVFRCGSQEEGAAASKLDTLLDQEEARQSFVPAQPQPDVEFEAPFEPVQWSIEDAAHFAEPRMLEELAQEARAAQQAEDDWVIESPAHDQQPHVQQSPYLAQIPHLLQPDGANSYPAQFRPEFQAQIPQAQFPQAQFSHVQEEEEEVVFTPDPRLVFPMPEENSEWAKQLEAVDRAFGEVLNSQQLPYMEPQSVEELYEQAQRIAEQMQQQQLGAGYRPGYDQLPVGEFGAFFVNQQGEYARNDDEAFVPESDETRSFAANVLEDGGAGHHPAVIEQVLSDSAEEAAVILPEPHAHTEQERPVAEYAFEDEVQEQEFTSEAVPEVVKGFGQKAALPKLSVGGKGPELVDSPIKLSALLGESRARESAAQQAQAESPSYQAAQLIRESQSYAESQTYGESANALGESATVYTSKAGHNSDSIWGDILNGHDSKVTMKFRIVQEEDNLTELAELYNTSVNDLVRANNLQRQDVAHGQILYIPTRRR